MRRLPTTAVLLAIVAVASGCGDSGQGARDRYQDRVNAITDNVRSQLSQLTPLTKDTSRGEALYELRIGAETFGAAARSLRAITPAPGTAAAHRKLIDGFTRLETSYRAGRSAVARNDSAALTRLVPQLGSDSPAAGELEDARQALADIGVDIATGAPASG